MYDICCIGHITLDRVVTPGKEVFMAGGTSFYFSNAIRNMDVKYGLITSIAETEIRFANDLQAKGIDVTVFPSAHTVYFENIYLHNQDHRTQRVLQIADPFTVEQLQNTSAAIFHLGPLLAGDISVELIEALSAKGKISLDVQGYLRKVEHENVHAIDWEDKMKALPFISILKANESEAEVLTGEKDIRRAALLLHEWGVDEVVITLGSLGSLIYKDAVFYEIPAYKPAAVIDATGCGDTYMAGYLYKRVKGESPKAAGAFAAAMASLKIEAAGAFSGTAADVVKVLESFQS